MEWAAAIKVSGADIWPQDSSHAFMAVAEKGGAVHWGEQAWADLTVTMIWGAVVSFSMTSSKGSMPPRSLYKLAKAAMDKKQSVSVRLRAFRGTVRVDGNGDVGRFAWRCLEEMVANDKSSLERVHDAVEKWKNLKDTKCFPDSVENGLFAFAKV